MNLYRRVQNLEQPGPSFGTPGAGFSPPAAGQMGAPELNALLLTSGERDSNGYYKATLVAWHQSPINTNDLTQDPDKGIVTPVRLYTDQAITPGIPRFVFGTITGITFDAPTPSDNGLQLYAGILGGDGGIQLVRVTDVTSAGLVSNKLVKGHVLKPTNDPAYPDRFGDANPSGPDVYLCNMCWDLTKPVQPFVGQRFWAKKIGTYESTGDSLPKLDLYDIQGEIQYGYLSATADPALPVGYPLAERGFDGTDPQRSYLVEPVTTGGLLRMKAKVAGVYSIELSGNYQLATVPSAASPIVYPISDWDPTSYTILDPNVVSCLLDLRTYYLTEIQKMAARAVLKTPTGYIQIYKNGSLLKSNAIGPFLSYWDNDDGYWKPYLYREGGAVVWQGVLAAGDEIGWGGGIDGSGYTASVYDVSCEMQYLGPDLSSLFD